VTPAFNFAFIDGPPPSEPVEAIEARYLADDGYVANYARVWCWRPDVLDAFAEVRSELVASSSLSPAEVAVLVAATASTLGDSYCSLAWGERLAKLKGEDAAAGVLAGADAGLSPREAALAAWARKVVRDPNGTTEGDVEQLREAGLDDREIFEATAWIGMRLGFSAINDALGIRPDRELAERVPASVGSAVGYGRSPMD
jgi:uncharacterized peroxidase-related enzyme